MHGYPPTSYPHHRASQVDTRTLVHLRYFQWFFVFACCTILHALAFVLTLHQSPMYFRPGLVSDRCYVHSRFVAHTLVFQLGWSEKTEIPSPTACQPVRIGRSRPSALRCHGNHRISCTSWPPFAHRSTVPSILADRFTTMSGSCREAFSQFGSRPQICDAARSTST